MRIISGLAAVMTRNRLLIAAIAVTFFSLIAASALVAYVGLLEFPGLAAGFRRFVSSATNLGSIPRPYTWDLYLFIFKNNIGHFWNPVRIWVWIPLVGAFGLGYELLLNAIVIGAVASVVSVARGAEYAFLGLTPHGVIELPAFVLEFAGLARWHIATTRAIYTKLSGRPIDRPLFFLGVKDAVAISVLSVALFAIAAFIEAFVTPHLLGL